MKQQEGSAQRRRRATPAARVRAAALAGLVALGASWSVAAMPQAAGATQAAVAAAEKGTEKGTEKVDINRADVEELSRVLVTVGPAKARAIVESRMQDGPFRSADDLVRVRGIGLATVERNADRIVVGAAGDGAPSAAAKPAAASAKPTPPAEAVTPARPAVPRR